MVINRRVKMETFSREELESFLVGKAADPQAKEMSTTGLSLRALQESVVSRG